MKSTVLAAWPKGYFVCVATNNLSFESESAGRSYMARYCGDGQQIDRIELCRFCAGYHVHSHARELSGASSGTGTRQVTLRLPASAIVTGRRLSAEDAKNYENQKS